RLGGGGRRGAYRADQREDLVFLQQLLDRFDRLGRLIAVIDALELKLATLDAAGLVDFREGCFQPDLHALAQGRGRAVERCGLTKHDLVGRHTVFGGCGNARREENSRRSKESVERSSSHMNSSFGGGKVERICWPGRR